ncbi:MAG TPA: hypothetical protein VGI39_21045 [Polyangiaceae bacterium]|jgi:hypothetical protein
MSFLRPALALALSAVAFSAACGGTADKNKQACADYAKASCALTLKCDLLVYAGRFLNDPSTCLTDETNACLAYLGIQGIGADSGWAESCAKTMTTATCAASLGAGPCGQPAGKLADGAACYADEQCSGRLCSYTSGATCGTCAEGPKFQCYSDSDCAAPSTCNSGTCGTLPGQGQTCAAGGCAVGLWCSVDPSSGQGTCVPWPKEGESCGSVPTCDDGLACSSATFVCTKRPIVNPGSSCAAVNGVQPACVGFCDGQNCLAYIQKGAVCTTLGTPCAEGTTCLSGTCTDNQSVPDICQ